MCAGLCGTRADRRSPESLISSSVSGGGDGGGIRNRTHFVSCILLIRMTASCGRERGTTCLVLLGQVVRVKKPVRKAL